jgi:hypothetical protein
VRKEATRPSGEPCGHQTLQEEERIERGMYDCMQLRNPIFARRDSDEDLPSPTAGPRSATGSAGTTSASPPLEIGTGRGFLVEVRGLKKSS